MQPNTHDQKTEDSRRTFLKSTGAVAAGVYLGGASSARGAETLAMDGGPKTVTLSQGAATKWPLYGDEEEKAVVQLLRNPNYGPIDSFEKDWKAFHKAPYVKAHCNGTSALTAMMFAMDLPPGSEVLVPSYSTWFAAVPMRLFGLVPVWVDIDPRTLNIDVEDCKKRLTKNTKAVLAVHWYGVPCEMDRLCEFGKEKGLIVLEDASHAHGAYVKDKVIGMWGRMSGFSLQMGKPLPAIEGGVGMYQHRADYERAVAYGHYKLPAEFPESSPYRKYKFTAFGSKLRIHPVAAILARLQLKHLAKRNIAGVAQMRRLNERLNQLPGLTEQYVRPDMKRVFYANNLMFIDQKKAGMSREVAVKALAAEGVSVSAYNWHLLHDYPIFQESKWWHHVPKMPGRLPGSDQANRTTIAMPYFTSEAPELADQYVKAFEKVWAHRAKLAKA